MGLVPLLVIFDNTQPTHEEPSPDDGLAAAKDNTRTRNFSVEEDKLLVSTWLNVSQNPIQGVDQARSTYWRRIHNYFLDLPIISNGSVKFRCIVVGYCN
jgi:hypothetical protein